jgi:glycosyltransferase involved in cell wall biosynthesis
LRLLFTINDLGLTDIVTWGGRLRPDEVVARLQQSDIFLLSSLSEGISNAVLEAMACGLPVVTTNVGGMAEAIADGIEGLLVPPRDPVAMADALAYLWARPEVRRQMGQAGRERVLADFDLDDQITAFEALFRSVA